MRRPLLLVLLAALAATAPLRAQAPPPVADSIDAWVEAYMRERKIPGVAIAIVLPGRIVRERGYGFADLEHRVPVTPATVFQSGSVGKQFTAAAVLLLAEEGKLSLDDPVSRHLDGVPAEWGAITVRHLLSHTSGIADYGPPALDFQRTYADSALLRVLYSMPLHFEPGSEWSYSNTGYVLLGAIIQRVTGAHWGELLERRVFEPLGMETARVISEAEIVPDRAAGYALAEGEIRNQGWVSQTFNSTADGALYLTVRDLAKWDAGLYGNAVLSEASRRAMWTPTRLSDGTEARYGLGWFVSEPGARRSVEHGGSWQGFRAHIARYPADSVTVVVLANAAHADAGWIAHNVAGLYRPRLAPVARRAIRVPARTLDEYAGVYRLPTGDTVRVARRDDALALEGHGREARLLRAYADDRFFERGSELRLLFERDPQTRRVHRVRLSGDPASSVRAVRVAGS